MIVIDMDMPESCNECPLFDNEYLHCQKTKERCETWAFEPKQSCPIKCDIEQIKTEIKRFSDKEQPYFNGIPIRHFDGYDIALQIIDKYTKGESE